MANLYRNYVKTMPSGVFAYVMATGVVSVGMHLVHQEVISIILWVFGGVGWLFLTFNLIVRAFLYPSALSAAFGGEGSAFGFFTFPAGTLVIGIRFMVADLPVWAFVFWIIGAVAWLFFGYLIPWLVLLRTHNLDSVDPEDLEKQESAGTQLLTHIDGTWFVWTVSTQSVAILAAMLSAHYHGEFFPTVAVICWSTGLALYLATFIGLVTRILRIGIRPTELGPSFWVVMGALAISCLAAGRLVDMDGNSAVAVAVEPIAAGVAIMLWGFATWLVVALLLLGIWRHLARRVTTRYVTTLWAMVFPMGVYSVASMNLGAAQSAPPIGWCGKVFIWVALTAWVLVILDWIFTKGIGRKNDSNHKARLR